MPKDTKQDVINRVADLTGIKHRKVGKPGSSVLKQWYLDVASYLRLAGTPELTKIERPKLGQLIVESAGLSWDETCHSQHTKSDGGGTVTHKGLLRIEEAVNIHLESTNRATDYWLFIWNREKYPWDELSAVVTATADGKSLGESTGAGRWSCSSTRNIRPGDKLILRKVGSDPKGIVGIATATSTTYKDMSWSDTDSTTNYVDLKWDLLLDPDLRKPMSVGSLSTEAQEGVHWAAQRSGSVVPEQIGREVVSSFSAYLKPRLNWTFEETLLAFDFYLKHRQGGIPGVNSEEIAGLSQQIRDLAVYPDHLQGPKYRNTNGVYQKIMNIRSHDPEYSGSGLEHGATLDKEIWDRFAGKLNKVAWLAEELRICAKEVLSDRQDLLHVMRDEIDSAQDDVQVSVYEGDIEEKIHKKRERKSLREKKIQSCSSPIVCEVCGFTGPTSTLETSPLEVHHLLPIEEGERQTRLEDLAVLCANCHRILHSVMRAEKRNVDINEFRSLRSSWYATEGHEE